MAIIYDFNSDIHLILYFMAMINDYNIAILVMLHFMIMNIDHYSSNVFAPLNSND